MIKLVATEDIYDVIDVSFGRDTHFHMLYHYESPASHEEAVDYSCEYNKVYVPKEAIFYAIYMYDAIIGFVSLTNDCVWDFHVNKPRRSEMVLDEVWEAIKKELPAEFTVRLYERNYRDINWLIQYKGAVPYKIEGRKMGYYEAVMESMDADDTVHTYFRDLSQIILKFTNNPLAITYQKT